ncbi:MAG: signal peptide peptidase SppA [Pseudomonadota bacterium]|nr:signal peptide peptidase SppA [Pseudomonadota bacterium]
MPIPVLAPLLLLPAAYAEGVERPTLPFRSLAGEDGVHVMYSNPALMNFDRDAGYAVYYDTTGTTGGLNSLTFATTGGGVGAGLGYRQVGAASEGWWTVSSAASVRVTDAVSIGSSFNWQLPDGGKNNFVSWDIGLGWRPAPFLGIGAVVQNLGSPAPDLGVNTRYGAGLALRPAGDLVTVGLDWLADAPPNAALAQRVQASVRLKPARGLWLRLFADDSLTDPTDVQFGGAIELRFADLGVGVTARSGLADLGGIGGGGYVQTIPNDDQLFRARRRVATFDFEGAYPYQPQGGLLTEAPEGYLTLLRRMKSAAGDPQVRGVLLEIDSAPFSLAQVEEIRAILREARTNGKPVVAYLNGEASNAAYLLATACDRVYLHPAGQLDLVGLGAETQYFRGALELVGVSAQYAKRGAFKSAPEQWTESQSTDPARLEMNELLDDLSGALVDGIAVGRGKSPEEIRTLIDKGPFTSQEAEKNGLVDGLVYPDQLQEALAGAFPEGFSRDESYASNPDTSGWEPQRAVAVVVIDGAISSGQSSSGGLLGGAATGSDTVVQALDQARRTDAVKAVVLRVDSPGGSAFASDEIWRAVSRVQEQGKPVIVSMGGYAASGGYYVAAGADAIYALPTTVTGSIGVYGGKINGGGLFEKLDIHTEQFNRGRNAGMYSISRPFDDIEFAALDRMIADTYRQFKDKVQDGRNLSPEKVEALAQGRVWSGSDAKEQGLVDEHGGFFDAVERARAEAGMKPDAPYTLVTYDPWGGGGDLPTQLVSADLPRQIIRAFQPKVELPPELTSFWALSALKDERVFAMMPYHLEIK